MMTEEQLEHRRERGRAYHQAHLEQERKRAKEYYRSNRDKELARAKKWYKEHLKQEREHKKSYYKANRSREIARMLQYHRDNREKDNETARAFNVKIKIEVLSHYGSGKPECTTCDERRLACLSIDHIEGGGREHRKIMRGQSFYRWLRKNDYPPGYQTLCMNCQWVKKDENQEYGDYAKKEVK